MSSCPAVNSTANNHQPGGRKLMNESKLRIRIQKLIDQVPEPTDAQRLSGFVARALDVAAPDARAILHTLAAVASIAAKRESVVMVPIDKTEVQVFDRHGGRRTIRFGDKLDHDAVSPDFN